MEFAFTLKYRLPAPVGEEADKAAEALLRQLASEGCGDAVCLLKPGRLILSFRRTAEGVDAAYTVVCGALSDVRTSAPDLRLIEAMPDLVGLTEVAQRLRMSRQNLRKLMVSHTSFPSPMHEGRATSVWHLCDVLEWLRGRGNRYSLAPGLIELSRVIMEVNQARQVRHMDMLRREVLSALAA